MRPRRDFLRTLASGVGAALCLPRCSPGAEPPPSVPPPGGPAKAPSGEPAPSRRPPPDFGAMVKKNYSGRG